MATLQLTTLAVVKALMEQDAPSTDADVNLTAMILAVSAAMEKHLQRGLHIEERTEVLSPPPYAKSLRLRALPVLASPALVVRQATDRNFADAGSIIEASSYYLDLEAGLILFDGELIGGPGTVQVVYTGGLALDQTALASTHPAVAQAATFWVKEMYDKRNQIGRSGESIAGQSVNWQDGLGEIPDIVARLVASYRRPVF